jgi:hypothetical protein
MNTTQRHAEQLGPIPGLPTRHGANVPKARRVARTLRWMLGRADAEPTPEQWRARAETLLQSDPLADDVVAWMREVGMARGMQMFHRALEHGIETLPDAPEALVRFFAAAEKRPSWVDPDLLAEGTRACHIGGLVGLRAMRDAALMGGYQASAINRTLILTGALARGAPRRLAETTKWWIDCTAEGGMARFAPGFKTTLHVRLMHALVRQRVRRMPEWDATALGLPVNQSDMQVTYLGFCVIYLLGQRALGVKITPHEAQGVMHLWRYIGWLMGVDENLLCNTELEGRIELYQNLLSQAPADDSSQQLGRALMDEPLMRHYPDWPLLRGRWERAKHISIARFFLSRESLVDLGLPSCALPWYPLAVAPLVFVRHRLLRLLPGGRERLIRQGRQQQEDYLRVLFGSAAPDVAQLQTHHP